MFFVFNFIPNQYKTQEMCDRVASEDLFLIAYCPDEYKTQIMCDEAVDSLAALELVPDWFVTIKMVKKLFTTLHADENIIYFNEDSSNVVFSCNEIGILNIDLNNISLDKKLWWRWFWYCYSYQTFRLAYLNLKIAKNLEKDKWRINSVAS